MYIHIYIYICMYMCIYIYIYREREITVHIDTRSTHLCVMIACMVILNSTHHIACCNKAIVKHDMHNRIMCCIRVCAASSNARRHANDLELRAWVQKGAACGRADGEHRLMPYLRGRQASQCWTRRRHRVSSRHTKPSYRGTASQRG